MNRRDRRRQLAELPKAPDLSARFANDVKIATTLHKQGRLKEAVDVYRKVVKVYEGHPDVRVAWSNLGAALQGLGKFDDAVIALKKARALKPDHPPPHHNLGMALLQQNKLEEALESLTRAIELDPNFHDAWVGLGIACEKLGDMGRAEDACRRALAADPRSLQARFNLANVLRQTGRPDAAKAELEACLAQEPNFAEAIYTLGRLEEVGGNPAAAAERYLATLKLVPQAEPVHNQLGQVLQALAERDPEQARRLAATWRETYTDSPIAQHRAAALLGEGTTRASDDFLVNQFNPFAEIYDEAMAAVDNHAPELLLAALGKVLGEPTGGLSVLDAGCGTGLLGPGLKPYAKALTGVDLSPGMVEKARARGVYDSLEVAELTAWLAGQAGRFDLVAAGDVLPYLGDLAGPVSALAGALAPGGTLGLTAERLEEGTWTLLPTGRYAHSESYLRQVLEGAGLTVATLHEEVLRREGGEPVVGYVVVAGKA